MDDIVLRCAKRCLKSPANQKFIKDEIIKPNSNFQYEAFRKMLMIVIGLATLEKIEKKSEKTDKISTLKGYLGNLKKSRNLAAHSHTKGTLTTYDAPSETIGIKNFQIPPPIGTPLIKGGRGDRT